MTVGLPGTGIGGLFYLLSAFALPMRRLRQRLAHHEVRIPLEWRVVLGQTALAAGIVAGLWATGWLLDVGLRAAHVFVPARLLPTPALVRGSVLGALTVAVTFGTLGMVLGGVELLRLCVSREEAVVRARRHSRVALLVAFAAVSPRALATQQASRPAVPLSGPLARADAAFAAGDTGAAAREYAIVLAQDPSNAHATYRLADLRHRDPVYALPLFQRYVTLVPGDPWGYLAVADALTRLGRYDAALRWYAPPLRLAPGERDVVVGYARALARAWRRDASIATYERWLAAHPNDAAAWRDLGRERLRAGDPQAATRAFERARSLDSGLDVQRQLDLARAARAPAITPVVSGTRDSDGNTTWETGGSVELGAFGPARLGATVMRGRVSNAGTSVGLEQLALQGTWRPRALVTLEAAGGATRLDTGATVVPTGRLRLRWRAPGGAESGGGPAIDLRAERSVLAASPVLVANRVIRTQGGATVELPLGSFFRLRAVGRAAALDAVGGLNHKTVVAGILAGKVAPSVEISAQARQIGFAHPSSAGYFAPHRAQILEAGSYAEIETSAGAVLALDLGAGIERVAELGTTFGSWRRALRLYAMADVPLAAGRLLRFEVDSEDSAVSIEGAPTVSGWRYGSASVSLRWAL